MAKDQAREVFPVVDLRHNDKISSDPNMRDFTPQYRNPHVLDDIVEPTEVELQMLEEQIEVAEELGVALDEVNPPSDVVSPPEANRPKERSKPA